MTFPKEATERAIRAELGMLDAEHVERAQFWRSVGPSGLDATSALCVLCRIEEDVGLYVSEECVPVGGFDNVEACVAAILGCAEATWNLIQ